jgi:hypothetical protein
MFATRALVLLCLAGSALAAPPGGRGVGGHRFWLPWISANHLYGMTGLEEYDPALFKQLTAKPSGEKR